MRNRIVAVLFIITCGLAMYACTADQPTAPAAGEFDLVSVQGHTEPEPKKITICHRSMKGGEIRYEPLRVSVNAEGAHRAHGDALPGEPVPGMDGYVFDDGCEPNEATPPAIDQARLRRQPLGVTPSTGISRSTVGGGGGE